MNHDLKTFMSVAYAANLAGLSLSHFRRIISEDHIPHFTIGLKVFLLREDFDKWMNGRGLERRERHIDYATLERWNHGA